MTSSTSSTTATTPMIDNNGNDDESLVFTMKGKPIPVEKRKKPLQKVDSIEDQTSKKRSRTTKNELSLADQIYEDKHGQEETKEFEVQEENTTQKKRRYSSIPNTRGLSNRKFQVFSDKSNILTESSNNNDLNSKGKLRSDSQKLKLQDNININQLQSKEIVDENFFQPKTNKTRRSSLSATTSTRRLVNREI